MTATPRARLVSAVLVAVLTTVTSLVAIGVSADDGQAESRDSMTFAEPHTGDQWAYEIDLKGSWPSHPEDPVKAGTPSHLYSFSLNAAEIRLSDLAVHDATRVDVEGYWFDAFAAEWRPEDPNWRGMKRSAWFGSDGVQAVEIRGGMASAGGSTSTSLPGGPPLFEQGSSIALEGVYRDFTIDLPPCLGPNQMAGQRVAVGDVLLPWNNCSLGGLMGLFNHSVSDDASEPSGLFRSEGFEDVQGMAALRLRNVEGVTLWFNPGIPYPLQVDLPAMEGRGQARLTMTGFQPGIDPFPVADLGPRNPLPAIVTAPAQPWGPDDTGSGAEFPASEAFAKARDAPDWSGLRDFLKTHPDATAVRGWFMFVTVSEDQMVMTQDRGRKLLWHFDMAGGSDCLSFSMGKEEHAPTLLLPATPPSYVARTESPNCAGFDGAPLVAPATWPTAASALATWRGYSTPTSDEPLAWAFIGGNATNRPEMIAGLPYAIGTEKYFISGSATGVVSGAGGLEIYGETPAGVTTRDVSYEYTSEVAGMPLPNGAAAPPAAEHGSASLPVALGSALSPEVAAGVSVLSLLAGALYFFWPTVKAGALGLFSRVQPEQVLEHPQRAKLVQAVESEPGIHYQALLRKTGLAKGSLEHHLQALVAAGQLRRVASGGYTCYFVGTPVPGASAVKADGARRLLQELQARPGQGLVEAAASAGLSPATASHHLARLEEAGLVTSLREGRSRRLFPTAVIA